MNGKRIALIGSLAAVAVLAFVVVAVSLNSVDVGGGFPSPAQREDRVSGASDSQTPSTQPSPKEEAGSSTGDPDAPKDSADTSANAVDPGGKGETGSSDGGSQSGADNVVDAGSDADAGSPGSDSQDPGGSSGEEGGESPSGERWTGYY